MRKSLTICLISAFLVTGCSQHPKVAPAPVVDEALFCDLMTEQFRYTQEEWAARVSAFPANLRREIELNQHFDRECVDAAEGSV